MKECILKMLLQKMLATIEITIFTRECGKLCPKQRSLVSFVFSFIQNAEDNALKLLQTFYYKTTP